MESNDPKVEGPAAPTPPAPSPAPLPVAPVIAVPVNPVAVSPQVINVPLPGAGGVISIGPSAVHVPVSAQGGEGVPADLTVFFLNDALLSTFGKIGALVFDMSQPPEVKVFPRAREAVAMLMNVDLNAPGAGDFVDAELASALAAYKRYLELNAGQLSFIQQVRVLLRDHDAPKKPIP